MADRKKNNNGGANRCRPAAAPARTGDGKRLILIAVLTVVITVGAVLGLVFSLRACLAGSKPPKEKGLQDISYTETLGLVANPDQGFYRPAFVRLSDSGATCSKPFYSDISLYHLRVDIGAFSDGHAIPDAAVAELGDVISFYSSRGASVIVRFAYDGFNGVADREPDIDAMLEHIAELSVALNAHTLALTAVEAGMVGPWGEMHTSAAASLENITRIVGAFIDRVEDAPVLVRTPKMIYAYLGGSVNTLDSLTVPQSAKRLGLFNDGYLGSDTDLGTYTDRKKETAWLSANITNHLPYGGEVTVPSSKLHDIDKCTREMFDMNLSYLNYEWNNEVVQDKWKKAKYTSACGGDKRYYGQSAYTYIRNRLGYRLVVRKSVFAIYDGELSVRLDIENVGFGNLNRVKKAAVLFVADGKAVSSAAAGEYGGGSVFTASVPVPASGGSYDVYLRLYSGDDDAPAYPIALANEKMYNNKISANRIGKIVV